MWTGWIGIVVGIVGVLVMQAVRAKALALRAPEGSAAIDSLPRDSEMPIVASMRRGFPLVSTTVAFPSSEEDREVEYRMLCLARREMLAGDLRAATHLLDGHARKFRRGWLCGSREDLRREVRAEVEARNKSRAHRQDAGITGRQVSRRDARTPISGEGAPSEPEGRQDANQRRRGAK